MTEKRRENADTNTVRDNLDLRAQAFVRNVLDFVAKERRPLTLAEMHEKIGYHFGDSRYIGLRTGDQINELLMTCDVPWSDRDDDLSKALRSIRETVFHNFPNSFNANPS